MKLNRKQMHERARAILDEETDGIRWGALVTRIHADALDTPENSIHGAVQTLFRDADDIIKIARGTYQLRAYTEADAVQAAAEAVTIEVEPVPSEKAASSESVTEQDFYASFAEWLVENDEATVADALGGAGLGGKWGTPDVIGVLKPRAQDLFKFEPQIVTAEIKAVPGLPVVAFGQAVAYRLFSHKTYIVIPASTGRDDMARLKALCSLHGVGLVTFALDVTAPDYAVVVLPALATPDMFYVNAMLDRLKGSEPKLLNRLF